MCTRSGSPLSSRTSRKPLLMVQLTTGTGLKIFMLSTATLGLLLIWLRFLLLSMLAEWFVKTSTIFDIIFV